MERKTSEIGRVKKAITVGLLAYVAIAIGYMVWKEIRVVPTDAPVASTIITARSASDARDQTGEDRPDSRTFVAYYFHLNKRCNTCRTIERLAKDAIETGFPEDLIAGRLQWRVVNLDAPGNDHYYKDFQLTGSALVLVELKDGHPSRFKTLTRTWDLFADEPALTAYVRDETRAWMGGQP